MFLTRWLQTGPRTRTTRPPNRRPRFRPQLEAMEDRAVPAVLVATTFVDEMNPVDGLLSLREAVALAAAIPGDDSIVLPHAVGGFAGTYVLSLGQLTIDD